MDTKQSRSLQRIMEQELRRSMRGLRLKDHPRPFFIAYMLHVTRGIDVWGRYGSVFNSEPINGCDLYSGIRVGSYRLDQTIDGGLGGDLADRESYNWLMGPQDLDEEALRYAFWKVTQHKYREALQEFYDKKKILVEQRLRQKAPSFSRETKLTKNHPVKQIRFSPKRWENLVRAASEIFKGYRDVVDPYVRIRGATRVRIFVNSEGTKFVCQEDYFEVIINGWYMTKDGDYLNASRQFHARQQDGLPSLKKINAAIEELVEELRELAKAKPMDPYAGPALLSGMATGLLFHEAIGHRLEGERMVSRTEGHTFASKVGKRILPKGVDVIDDPSMAKWDGTPLFGHYSIDDEGVKSQPAKLVEDGVLKSFLMSRTCVPGFRQSNGHGRQERHQDPMARMANLIVKSRDKRSWDDLKELLMKEVRDRKLPRGIIIRNVSSGETRTDHYDFQAFKGVPTSVFTIDPKNGKEIRVRDVNFIGTPLAAIQRIKAFGNDYEVDNSYCFAESGSVPVSTVAPAMVVDELELQRATTRYFRPPITPFPPMKIKK